MIFLNPYRESMLKFFPISAKISPICPILIVPQKTAQTDPPLKINFMFCQNVKK